MILIQPPLFHIGATLGLPSPPPNENWSQVFENKAVRRILEIKVISREI
jgi:hypothetical protein